MKHIANNLFLSLFVTITRSLSLSPLVQKKSSGVLTYDGNTLYLKLKLLLLFHLILQCNRMRWSTAIDINTAFTRDKRKKYKTKTWLTIKRGENKHKD